MDIALLDHYRDSLIPVITDNLLPAISFVNQSRDDRSYVNGDVVRLPQRGKLPKVEINRETVPAQAKKREDSVHGYNLAEFSTDPTVVSLNEETVVSYDKSQTVLQDHIDIQNQFCAEACLDVWSPDGGGVGGTSRIFATTGEARDAATIPSYDEDGAAIELTGQRKRITKEDFIKMSTVMNRNNIPQENRVCLLTASQHDDLLQIAEFVDANKTGLAQSALLPGSVGRMAGFDIFVRSSALFYSPDGTAKRNNVLRDDIQGTDSEAALFWHPNFVRKAMGDVNVFLEARKAAYYGDIMSTCVRFGGETYYKSGKGVYVLLDATV